MAIKRGIDAAVAVVVQELQNLSKPTQDQREIAQVGTISANNDETIGKIIAVITSYSIHYTKLYDRRYDTFHFSGNSLLEQKFYLVANLFIFFTMI